MVESVVVEFVALCVGQVSVFEGDVVSDGAGLFSFEDVAGEVVGVAGALVLLGLFSWALSRMGGKFQETKMRNTPLAGLRCFGVARERFRWWGANRGEVGEGFLIWEQQTRI